MSGFDNRWLEVFLKGTPIRPSKPKVPFTPPLGKTVVVNKELAEEAEELARTEKIGFGEALQRVRQPKVPFTPPLGNKVVVGMELAEEAEELARTEKIEFGEALMRVRQERV